MSTADRVEDVDATVGLVDGRVSMSATGPVRVETPDHTPLSTCEPHLTLRVATDNVPVVLDFDGDDLGALAAALGATKEADV
jgi:hypothetical protein